MWNKNKGIHQMWDIVYVDEYVPVIKYYKDGELNKELGVHVERSFYIVSALDSGRYVDLINNKLAIKTRNG